MSQIHTGNLYRKVRALLNKTTANGCTPGEAASALEFAYRIVRENGLSADRLDWPLPPAGYRLESTGGIIAVVEVPRSPKREAT